MTNQPTPEVLPEGNDFISEAVTATKDVLITTGKGLKSLAKEVVGDVFETVKPQKFAPTQIAKSARGKKDVDLDKVAKFTRDNVDYGRLVQRVGG